MEGFADIISICDNQHQQVRDKYQNHFLIKYAHEECKDKVLHLLEKLERFRIEEGNVNDVIDQYEFDLARWQKKQIFTVCKEIRSCLSIGKNAMGQYLLNNTNLGKDCNNPNKSISLNTILNQI
jgi:NADH:ubiquinone oxidoreductase subunit E